MRHAAVILIVLTGSAGPTARDAAETPLEVGSARQLFIDDHVIASRAGLERALHAPERHAANPVLVGDRSWEKWVVEVDGRPLVHDEAAGEFRMYYVAPLVDPSAPGRIRYKTCVAMSGDGVHWNRADLGQVDWEGSRHNNILPWGENWMRRPNVILDPVDPDPERRYKMTYVDVMGGLTAITKAYSRDGLRWNRNGDGKPWFRKNHNLNLLGWDARIRQYVLFPRMEGLPNAVGRSTSPDFVTWSEPQTVLAPGPSDTGKDFKGNAVFSYEGMYLGLLWVFDQQATADAELVSSRDGIQWHRVFPGRYLFARGTPGDWDSEMILPNAPVVHGGKIWIYYTGQNMKYSDSAGLERANAGWFENGRRMQRAIGVATLRQDGFVSLDAGTRPGTLTTHPLKLSGSRLDVNADVSGELRVEVADEAGHAIPGYEAEACRLVRGDSLAHAVSWRGKQNLAELRGRPIVLRFVLRSGRLYAFGFGSGGSAPR